MFMQFFEPLSEVLDDVPFMTTVNILLERFREPTFFATLVSNVLEHANELAILLLTVPGADCFTIGYRIATFERFLMGISYPNVD